MPIDPEVIHEVAHELAERLCSTLEGHGDNDNLTAFVVVARVTTDPTDAMPARTRQVFVNSRLPPDVDDELGRDMLTDTLEEALKLVRRPRVNLDDLPPLDD